LEFEVMNLIRPLSRASFALVLLLGVAGCVSDRQVIAQANEQHRSLTPAVMTNGDLDRYLQSIGERIIDSAKEYDQEHAEKGGESREWMFSKDMQFHLVNSETLNAFTTGGEHMYIYSELFETCRSEDELAAVMAHEYAHVYGRHVHKGIQRQYLIVAGSAAAGLAAGQMSDDNSAEIGALASAGALMIGKFLSMGYTRSDEANADELGFVFYTRAGWDPDHFGDFFQQLIDKGMDTTPEAMSDHPSLSSRVAAAKQRAAKLPPAAEQWRRPPVADLRGYAEKKQLVAQVSATSPSDADIQAAQTLLSAVPSCVLPNDAPEQKAAQTKLEVALSALGKSMQRQ
jgi:predicted Zn-dependent protease